MDRYLEDDDVRDLNEALGVDIGHGSIMSKYKKTYGLTDEQKKTPFLQALIEDTKNAKPSWKKPQRMNRKSRKQDINPFVEALNEDRIKSRKSASLGGSGPPRSKVHMFHERIKHLV